MSNRSERNAERFFSRLRYGQISSYRYPISGSYVSQTICSSILPGQPDTVRVAVGNEFTISVLLTVRNQWRDRVLSQPKVGYDSQNVLLSRSPLVPNVCSGPAELGLVSVLISTYSRAYVVGEAIKASWHDCTG